MSSTTQRENPDHESLAQLARENPEAFEALRREMLDELIARAPKHIQRRLQGLQFRIDHVRARARTPLGAVLKISSLMWKSFLQLNEELSSMNDPPALPPKVSRIIAFPQRALPHRELPGSPA